MSVYVDMSKNRYGRMIMCHMLADSIEELHEMADRIGVARKWIQTSRTGLPHYDICQKKRKLAMDAGAIEVTRLEVVGIMRAWDGRAENDTSCTNTSKHD